MPSASLRLFSHQFLAGFDASLRLDGVEHGGGASLGPVFEGVGILVWGVQCRSVELIEFLAVAVEAS